MLKSGFPQVSSGERILLVDDSVDSLRLMQVTLKLKGYKVTVTDSGVEALTLIEQSPPDLILLDILMPDMDGYEVTSRIRQNTKLPFIPILLLTGSNQSCVVKGLDSGADEFIRKPVEKEELLARMRALLRLKHSIDQQVKLSQQREEFVTRLTHDLRTPLLGSSQVLELLRKGTFGDSLSHIQGVLEQMVDSNQTLLDMVDTLLEVYQYEAGCKTLSFFTVDLWELSQRVVRELTPLAQKKGLTLKLVLVNNLDDSCLNVKGDRLELHRLLTNLIGNAIRFTDKGLVELRFSWSSEQIMIEVEDTGIGISAEEQLSLFERFRQGNHQRKGNGLGLCLSRQIVEAHQGTITVKSEVGFGSVFTVCLPTQQEKSHF